MNTDIITYIEENLPQVIFNPVQLPGRLNAVGFVVTDNKLIIGFIKRDGSLCKLIEPVDLTNFTNMQLRDIIEKIPIVNGFSERDKSNLLKVFTSVDNISPKEQTIVEQEISERIQQGEKPQYTPVYDQESERILLLREQYLSEIKDYKQQIEDFKTRNREVIKQKEELNLKIQDYKTRLNEYLLDISVGIDKSYNRIKMVIQNLKNERDNVKKIFQTLSSQFPELGFDIEKAEEQIAEFINSLRQKDLEIQVLREYKTKCAKDIQNEKERIKQALQEYNEKWKTTLENSNLEYEKTIEEIKGQYQMITSQFEKLQKDNNLTEEENIKLKDTIRELQSQLDKISTEQIIELQKKYAEEIDRKEIELQEERMKNEQLREQLEKFEKLNQEEVFTDIKSVDYLTCKKNSVAVNFSRVNDTLLRTLEKIDILFQMLTSEKEIKTISPEQREQLINKLDEIRERTKVHINYFFNLRDFNIESNIRLLQNREVEMDENLQNFCLRIADITNYWKAAEVDFLQDQNEITNIYEDIAGAVRVFVRIRPHPTERSFQIPPQNPNMLLADCPESKGFYGPFYGIFDQEFNNRDIFTGVVERDLESPNEIIIPNIENYLDLPNNGLYKSFKQVESGYSIVIFGYGYSGSGKTHSLFGDRAERGTLHYALANLKDVKQIEIKHAFELYKNRVAVQENYISGKVIDLLGKRPENIPNEVIQTEKIIDKMQLDINNLNSELDQLVENIDNYRKQKNRIRATPNNQTSSRSHLFLVFEIQFTNNTRGYITFVDMAGRESPLDLYSEFLDKRRITLSTLMRMGTSKREREKLQMYVNEEYSSQYNMNSIYEILQEGFYVNESINHLSYFFQKKNFKETKVMMQKRLEDYNVKNFYVNPEREERGQIDISSPNMRNCLMIPILQYLDSLSRTTQFKLTKFIMLCNVRQERSKCFEILETLDFANSIKST
jgi:hypothetical protein